MKFLHLAGLIGLVQFTFACATGSLPEAATFDLEAMLAREAEPLEPQQLRSPDGVVRALVPARSAAEITFDDGVYTMELDIGGEGNINCWVYPEGIDVASTVSTISNLMLGEEAVLGEIEAKQIELTTAGAIDRYPYLGVRWMYRVLENEVSMLGQLGLLTANKGPVGVACLQNEVGFNQTFMRVFSGLVSTLAVNEDSVPYYAIYRRFL